MAKSYIPDCDNCKLWGSMCDDESRLFDVEHTECPDWKDYAEKVGKDHAESLWDEWNSRRRLD
jgi:hypothetical protein